MIGFAPRVVVMAGDPDLRDSLARLLKSAGYQAEVYTSAEDLLAQPPVDGPACGVIGLNPPGIRGVDLCHELGERFTLFPVIFLTACADVPTAVRAMKAGAVDVLTEPFDGDRVLVAVREAMGRAEAVRTADATAADVRRRAETLTAREREVMGMVVEGRLNKEIAGILGVSLVTVKVHRGRVMRKMAARSVPDLVRMADRVTAAQPAVT